ncbi:MAG: ATP-binding cassette domain-containing protein [Chloroflexota bacterium]|nr:ATP-binding cassette domain-containing protein [Chloroflexota bacterium]
MPIIKVENLTFIYREAKEPALKNISLTVEAGEFVGVIGSTGAGKTTLCLALAGIIPFTVMGKMKGRVWITGMSTIEHEVSELAQTIGLVLQDAQAQLLMTDVEKEIVFPLENLALPREEIGQRLEAALELVHLQEFRQLHPFYLSGGQRQRVALASILAMEPDILVLDEATSELDPIGVEEVLSVVSELKARGKTIILVEHAMEELVRFADRIVVMSEGEKIADGPAREILTNIELLNQIGVYPPQVTLVATRLRELGIEVPTLPLTLDEGGALLELLMAERAT